MTVTYHRLLKDIITCFRQLYTLSIARLISLSFNTNKTMAMAFPILTPDVNVIGLSMLGPEKHSSRRHGEGRPPM